MKQKIVAAGMLVAGLLLMAASIDPGLPKGYWHKPAATAGSPPARWSELEANLHPEACGQCHEAQFDAWKDSLHAHAYSPGMIGQFPAMGYQKANGCLACHALLAEQAYPDDKSMRHSLKLRLKHDSGFDREADIDKATLPLRHAGVTCAACHVRGWQRFGPPPKGGSATGHLDAAAHGGFVATSAFERSGFCASCHQFPQSKAINGKPLENTLTEWKNSSFGEKGITCQQCHMPDRRHEFRGIHDPEMVRKGLDITLLRQADGVRLRMTSKWIGHAFPTYVTPEIIVRAEALNAAGKVLQNWQWKVGREVAYDRGWKELRDTRLMPGEKRDFTASPLPAATTRVHYRITVVPDKFYQGVYRRLLSADMTSQAQAHIKRAARRAAKGDYLLFDGFITI
ncbi:multiheme c-type cytochrome [Mariprofundus ferrooxydans]|uniref:Cytochrome c-552/4 domain-containing protein n=1 Tax=Mariprofundus ferrooxydans PV-1 TaxID=314345 RepID=Q0F393_9PROT|nr:multiheme c-type cytochrome [Mariprofundus ferrooxydans]EAU56048.1 hypothetical protein SPV1_04488 [Mariprofundus ferrooxydans PV-1]KON46635.1 hypothetical protein AL013_12020 [Mariprofundus ferrooxydans]